jgi:hypothetical protein
MGEEFERVAHGDFLPNYLYLSVAPMGKRFRFTGVPKAPMGARDPMEVLGGCSTPGCARPVLTPLCRLKQAPIGHPVSDGSLETEWHSRLLIEHQSTELSQGKMMRHSSAVPPASSASSREVLDASGVHEARDTQPQQLDQPQRRRSDPDPPSPVFGIAEAGSQPADSLPPRANPARRLAVEDRIRQTKTPAEFERMYTQEAVFRGQHFPVDVHALPRSTSPRAYREPTPSEVRRVLVSMVGAENANRFMPAMERTRDLLWHMVPQSTGDDARQLDPRFATGVQLEKEGREALARYYKLKYDVDIRFEPKTPQDGIIDLLEEDMDKSGDGVRCVHYFGHTRSHATLLIYVREDGQDALIWLDSAQRANPSFGIELSRRCAALAAKKKRPVAVYQRAWGLQRDANSCYAYAMKTAVMLAGRSRNLDGGFDGFIYPNLLDALSQRKTSSPAPEGVVTFWALPEEARMGQSLSIISAHAGPDLDKEFVGSRKRETLRMFLTRHTYETDTSQQADYMRQKGLRFAENIMLQRLSDRIRHGVAAREWDASRHLEFVRLMKLEMRTHVPPTIDALIASLGRGDVTWDAALEDLEYFLGMINLPPAFSHSEPYAALTATVRAEIARMEAELPQMRRLSEVLSSASLDELDELGRRFEADLRKLARLRNLVDAGKTTLVSFGESEDACENRLRVALTMVQQEPDRRVTWAKSAAKDFLEDAKDLDDDADSGEDMDFVLFGIEDKYLLYKATRDLCDEGLRKKVEKKWGKIAPLIDERRNAIADMEHGEQRAIMEKITRFLDDTFLPETQ